MESFGADGIYRDSSARSSSAGLPPLVQVLLAGAYRLCRRSTTAVLQTYPRRFVSTELVSLHGMKNQHDHLVCWMSAGRNSGLMRSRTHTRHTPRPSTANYCSVIRIMVPLVVPARGGVFFISRVIISMFLWWSAYLSISGCSGAGTSPKLLLRGREGSLFSRNMK